MDLLIRTICMFIVLLVGSASSQTTGSCDFSSPSDTCGYSLPIRWMIHQGPYMFHQRVTLIKDGIGDGSYAFFDSSSPIEHLNMTVAHTGEPRNTSYDLTSPIVSPGSYRLSYWYILPAYQSYLEVLLVPVNGAVPSVIYSRQGKEDYWIQAVCDVNITEEFQIVFRGFRWAYGQYIGIDSIRLDTRGYRGTKVKNTDQSHDSTKTTSPSHSQPVCIEQTFTTMSPSLSTVPSTESSRISVVISESLSVSLNSHTPAVHSITAHETHSYIRQTTAPYIANTTPTYIQQTSEHYNLNTSPTYTEQTTAPYYQYTTPTNTQQTTAPYYQYTTPTNTQQTTAPYYQYTTPTNTQQTTAPYYPYTTPKNTQQTSAAYYPYTTSTNTQQTVAPYTAYTSPTHTQQTIAPYYHYTTPTDTQQTTAYYHQYTTPTNTQQTTEPYHQHTTPTNTQHTSAPYYPYTTPTNTQQTAAPYTAYTTPTNTQQTSAPYYQYTTPTNTQQTTAPYYQYTPTTNTQQTAVPYYPTYPYKTLTNTQQTAVPYYQYITSKNIQQTAVPYNSMYQHTTSTNSQKTTASYYQYTTPTNTQETVAAYTAYTTPKNTQQTTAPYHQYTTPTDTQQITAPYYQYTTNTNTQQKTAPYYQYTTPTNTQQSTESYYQYKTPTNTQQTTAPYHQHTTPTNTQQPIAPYYPYTTSTNTQQTVAPYTAYTTPTNTQQTTTPYYQYTTPTNTQQTTAPYTEYTTPTNTQQTNAPYTAYTAHTQQTVASYYAYTTPANKQIVATYTEYSTPTSTGHNMYVDSITQVQSSSYLRQTLETSYTPHVTTPSPMTPSASATPLSISQSYSRQPHWLYPSSSLLTPIVQFSTAAITTSSLSLTYSSTVFPSRSSTSSVSGLHSSTYNTPPISSSHLTISASQHHYISGPASVRVSPTSTSGFTPKSAVIGNGTSTNTGPTLEEVIHLGCTSTAWNVTIDMSGLHQIYPNASQENIFFGDTSCRGTEVGDSLVFKQGLRECLTSERISDDKLMYNNDLFYAIFDPQNPIIRQHQWTFSLECDISRAEVTSKHVHHEVESHHASVTTHYDVNIAFFTDPNFNQPISGQHIKIGDDVYVKVFTTVPDWMIKMHVHTCYTKPDNSASDQNKYYLIKNGCEVDRNTHIISQSTHESRFVFRDFEYPSNHEGLNIYCDATFCKSMDYSTKCLQVCNPGAGN